jgi:hypothetical protein
MKKLIVSAIAAAMLISLLSISSFAADASKNPADIIGKTTYAVTPLADYEEDLGNKVNITAGRCSFEIVKSEISGNAIKLTSGDNTAEAIIKMDKEYDFRGYDGIMFWVDLSGVVPSANDATGIGIRFWSLYTAGGSDYMWTRNTVEPIVEDEDFSIVAYYQDGAKWKATDPTIMNGERNQLPNGYKGWVYIPFTSYVSNVGPEGKPVAGLYGHDSINKYMILTGPYSIKDKNDQPTNYTIIFDELQLVKLDVTQDGLADALKEFQTDNNGSDSEKESESFNDDDPFGEDSESKKVSTEKPQSAPSVVTTENAGESGSSNTAAIIIIAVAAAAVIAVAVVLIIRKKK